MQRILVLTILALMLSGCGPVASPTHYEYDNHAVTTTTTTTAGAELAQGNNRPVCVGLVVLGSCNTTATQTQAVNRVASAATLPAGDALTLEVVVNAVLIAGAITALFLMLWAGIRQIFGVHDIMDSDQ
jgi:uncharacterized protein YceK